MSTRPLARVLLTASLFFAAACNGVVDGGSSGAENSLIRGPFPPPILLLPKDHSFLAPTSWGASFTASAGWQTPDTPVVFGRVNRDLMDDFIGFGFAGVYVGLSAGNKLASTQFVLAQFGTNQGWHSDRHVRLIGDLNDDGLDDIVGFNDAGVYTALSDGTGFSSYHFALADFGYNQGWRTDKHVRVLADVNGDRYKDIVAFGDAGVYVSFGDGAGGFGPAQFLVAQFGAQQAWTNANNVRTAVDLNGDGRADLVGFGNDGVWTALSTGNGFAAPRFVLADFGYNQGWRVGTNPRSFADMDADGRKDIVGFGAAGLYTARSLGDGTFGVNTFLYADCGPTPRKSCVVTDLNGDGWSDLLVYAYEEWNQALGRPGQLLAEQRVLRNIEPDQWTTADLDGNGMADVVTFNYDKVEVALSTAAAPAPAPAMPTNLTVGDATSSSLTMHWTDNATNETGFQTETKLDDGEVLASQFDLPANSTSTVHVVLDAATTYCYRLRAVNAFTYSDWTPWACGKTLDATPPTSGTWTVYLNEDPPPTTGAVTYTGRWYPQGRSIVRFRSAYTNGDQILFVKRGYSPSVCYTNPSAVISLPSNGTLLPSAISQISWNNSDGSVDFHGCLGAVQASTNPVPSLVFNLDWQQ